MRPKISIDNHEYGLVMQKSKMGLIIQLTEEFLKAKHEFICNKTEKGKKFYPHSTEKEENLIHFENLTWTEQVRRVTIASQILSPF